MINAEDLCRSIAGQLASFTKQIESKYHTQLQPLREENAALRARLASLSRASSFVSNGSQICGPDENVHVSRLYSTVSTRTTLSTHYEKHPPTVIPITPRSPREKSFSLTPQSPREKPSPRTPRGVSYAGDDEGQRLMFFAMAQLDGQERLTDEDCTEVRPQASILFSSEKSRDRLMSTQSTILSHHWSSDALIGEKQPRQGVEKKPPPFLVLSEDRVADFTPSVHDAKISELFRSSSSPKELSSSPDGASMLFMEERSSISSCRSRKELAGMDTMSKMQILSQTPKARSPEDVGQHMELVGALLNWYKILAKCLKRSLFGMMPLHRAKLESSLLLRPAWEANASDLNRTRSLGTQMFGPKASACAPLTDLQSSNDAAPESFRRNKWSRFIFHPDSKWMTPWAIASALVILWDVITFPIAGFNLEDTDFTIFVMWATTIFWTLDVFLTLIRGVHKKGVIELRPFHIALHYAKTWLILDVLMVATDWVFIYFTMGGGTDMAGINKILRSGKALRAACVLRAVRLIRTVKVFQSLRDIVENMKSEYFALVIKLSCSILAIVIMSHYVTCLWYAQAHFGSKGKRTWITEFLRTDPREPFLLNMSHRCTSL